MVKNANGLVFDHFYISPFTKGAKKRTVAHCKYTTPFRGGQFNMTHDIFEMWPELFILCSYIKALNAEVLVGIKDRKDIDIVPEARELQLYQNQCARASGGWKSAMSQHMRGCAITAVVGAVGLHEDIKKSSYSQDVKSGIKHGWPIISLPSHLKRIHGFFEYRVYEEVPSLGDSNSPFAGGRGGFGPGHFVWGMVDHPYVNDVLAPGVYEPAAVGQLNRALANWIAGLDRCGVPNGAFQGLLDQAVVDLGGEDYADLP
jgi:hypothetical protein